MVDKKTKVKEKKVLKSVTKKEPVKKTAGLNIPVYDVKGKEKGSLELPKEIFAVEINKPLIAQAIRVYQANQRQGNASTKSRGEVIGSTRKIYRQKGTGKARHGSVKAPIFVGGGVVGGPRPKDFSLKIADKQKRKAIFSALSLQVKEKKIIGLEDKALKIDAKTKLVSQLLEGLKMSGKKVTFVLPKMEKNNFVLASRNIERVKLIDAKSINIFEILNSSCLVFFEQSLEVLKNHFIKNSK